jgi:hypothetical protein
MVHQGRHFGSGIPIHVPHKKVKGQKPAPDRNLSSTDEIKRAFLNGLISKASVLSRVAELFDPAGWYEPIKVQMKMSFQELTPLDWANKVSDDQIDVWVSHFAFMQSACSLSIPRYAFPSAADPDSRIRLICLADAAEGAGGVASSFLMVPTHALCCSPRSNSCLSPSLGMSLTLSFSYPMLRFLSVKHWEIEWKPLSIIPIP